MVRKKQPREHVIRTRIDDETYSRLTEYINNGQLFDPKLTYSSFAEEAIKTFLKAESFWGREEAFRCQTTECPFYKFAKEHHPRLRA